MNRGAKTTAVVLGVLVLVVSLLGNVGCSGSPNGQDLPQARYRAGWIPSPTGVADWVAIGRGYFVEEGIDVEVTPGTGQEDTTMLVAAGEYDIGCSSAVPAIAGIAQGMPIKVVAVINQHNTLGMIVLESSGIRTPKDMEGRRVAIYPHGESFAMWKKFVEVNNLDPSTITELSLPYGMEPLLTGQVDVKPCGIGDESFMIEQPTIEFPFSDYAQIDRYTDCLIVNNEFAEKHPDEVRAFVNAYLRAMVFSMEDPETAAEDLMTYGKPGEVPSGANLTKACKRLTDFYVSEDTAQHGLGYSTPENWQKVVDFMLTEGVLETAIPVQDIFTNEYLPDPPIFAP